MTELATEIERQNAAKRDFIADTAALQMSDDLKMEFITQGASLPSMRMPIQEHAHRQIASRANIPAAYYDRMRKEAPGLLADNVNYWFTNKPEKRMVRTLDGRVRAVLSDRYRPLDNYDLAQAVLPQIAELDCEVHSCQITEQHMYLKVLNRRLTQEVKRGDVVQAGLVISNSEIGSGSLRVEPLVFRLICLNGAIASTAMRRFHVGRRNAAEDGAVEYYLDDTRRADDRAFFLKVRDTVAAAMTAEGFGAIVNRMQAATERAITDDPVKVVERAATRWQLNNEEQGGVLRHLISGGDLSAYGLLNAITRHSQEVAEYERATELERTGGEILEMPQTEWQKLNAA